VTLAARWGWTTPGWLRAHTPTPRWDPPASPSAGLHCCLFLPKNSRRKLSLHRCLKRQLQPLHKPELFLSWISGCVPGVLCFQQPPLVLESKLLFLLAAMEPLSMNCDFPPLRSKLGPSFFCGYLPPDLNFSPQFLNPALHERLVRLRAVPFDTTLSPCAPPSHLHLSFSQAKIATHLQTWLCTRSRPLPVTSILFSPASL